MKVKITDIQSTSINDFNGLTRTWFKIEGNDEPIYVFHKPETKINVRDELEGTITIDKGGNQKFTRERAQMTQNAPRWPFQADPVKLKQEYTLEQAKNMSIQRQVALKGAIDLVMAGQVKFTGLDYTYIHLMELLSEPNFKEFLVDLPPIENYEDGPTDEDVDNFDFDRDYPSE